MPGPKCVKERSEVMQFNTVGLRCPLFVFFILASLELTPADLLPRDDRLALNDLFLPADELFLPADGLSVPSDDFYGDEQSSNEWYPYDVSFSTEISDTHDLGSISDPSFFATEIADFNPEDSYSSTLDWEPVSDFDQEDSSALNWDGDAILLAGDSYASETSCLTDNRSWMNDYTFADDGILHARDNEALCPNPRADPPMIDLNLDLFENPLNELSETMSTTKKKPNPAQIRKKYRVPKDPLGRKIEEVPECVHPHEKRCCCQGEFTWGMSTQFGYSSLYEFDGCSVGRSDSFSPTHTGSLDEQAG